MDILDRLLSHDAWTTRQLLLRSRDLTDDQLDRRFDIGLETLRRTLLHIIGNMEAWSDVIAGRPIRPTPEPRQRAESADSLIARLDAAAAELATVARRIRDEGRLDETWVDRTDGPPTEGTRGGAIVHVITHSMHHRAEVLHMLHRLGVPDLIEGDVLSWEQAAAVAQGASARSISHDSRA